MELEKVIERIEDAIDKEKEQWENDRMKCKKCHNGQCDYHYNRYLVIRGMEKVLSLILMEAV